MPIFQTLVNRGTLGHRGRWWQSWAESLPFWSLTLDLALLSQLPSHHPTPELLLGPLHLGLGKGEWPSVSEEGMSGSWERDQHWASQDAG